MDKVFKCGLCNNECVGFPNNPAPIKYCRGVCERCNFVAVLAERMRFHQEGKQFLPITVKEAKQKYLK